MQVANHMQHAKHYLPSNQPLERTLPRCALQRRSRARWASV